MRRSSPSWTAKYRGLADETVSGPRAVFDLFEGLGEVMAFCICCSSITLPWPQLTIEARPRWQLRHWSSCTLSFIALHAQVVFALRLVEMFNRVAQRHARHGGSVRVEEAQQLLAVLGARCPEPSADRLVDQVVVI